MIAKEHEKYYIAAPTSWASRSLGNDPHVTLETFQKGLTVGLISTDRSAFETCCIDEELATVIERNRHKPFDFLPVTDKASNVLGTCSRIIGLIEVASLNV